MKNKALLTMRSAQRVTKAPGHAKLPDTEFQSQQSSNISGQKKELSTKNLPTVAYSLFYEDLTFQGKQLIL